MKFEAIKPNYRFSKNDAVALFLPEKYKKDIDRLIPKELREITGAIKLDYFAGKGGETFMIALADAPTVIVVGMGKRDSIDRETLRRDAGALCSVCTKREIKALTVVPPVLDKIDETGVIAAIAEGLSLANYAFNKYKTKKDEGRITLAHVAFHAGSMAIVAKQLSYIETVSANTLLCRDLVNETADASNPLAIAHIAKGLAKMKSVHCTVIGGRQVEKMGMGLLTAVGRGSAYPPQLVVLEYRGNPSSKKKLVIVGKGITFDSGGLNLKPSGHIEAMRSDMAGAAACIYALKCAAELKLKKNITAVVPLCENMLGGRSYKPGDVYKAYNGMNVEIGNTDAEGRLILADAIAYAVKRLKPDYVIDLATLTGACLVCFGEIIAALLSSDDKLADTIFESGEACGERLWRLPLYRDYRDEIKSDIADIKNVSTSRNAGTIVGAVFLKNFTGKVPWAHIDIAGTSWFSKQRGYSPKNATGYGVRLLLEVFQRLEL